NWTQIAAAGPVPRESTLAYDPSRGRAVLFGGAILSNLLLADTWEWDGSSWSLHTPVTGPAMRESPSLAYDSLRARTVLFGGDSGPIGTFRCFADTWEWDGGSWFLQTPATVPPARTAQALTFDPVFGRAVMFGGSDASPAILADTWVWDGFDWSLRAPATAPPGRFGHALAFDVARARAVLFGGAAVGQVLADTWEWDRANWLQRLPAPSPPPRRAPAPASDAAPRRPR